MTTPDDDEALRLNTLHRFSKHSPRLLLQEYSHCEVPAGCGGVVLRWIDRRGGLPAIVRVAALAPVRSWIDGRLLVGSRIDPGPGSHALTFELAELPRPNTPMFIQVIVNLANDNEVMIASGSDDRWWTSRESPTGAWMEPGYDGEARGWERASVHPNWESEVPESERWRWTSLARAARPIALLGTTRWLRCEFTLGLDEIARRFADAEERARDR